MSRTKWLDNVRRAMDLELREIALIAQLAEQLPTAAARAELAQKICEEAMEAVFWNTVYASHCEEDHHGPGCDPGYAPGHGPGYDHGYDFGYGPGCGNDNPDCPYGPGSGYGSGHEFGPGSGYGPNYPGYGSGIYKTGEETDKMKEKKKDDNQKE